jgi:epoxyqueuosine reductase
MTDERMDAIRTAAEEMGFVARWAAGDLPPFVEERYRHWLAEKRHATMGELLRGVEVRFDPLKRFGWVRSALTLAVPHAFPDPGVEEGGVRLGRVGRMFWVREQGYLERVLRPKIEAVRTVCREHGVRSRDWVDQGPLPIRSHAAQSGLGWVGRNGMVITPELGTYTTLAVLLTDLEVPAAAPHKNRCGSCHKCVPACPTGALLGDGTLDARRCISYWTTQHPGMIPPSIWPQMQTWLFGCDVCQEVCPWNAKAEAFWSGYMPEATLAHPDLRTFFSAYADGHAFERLYGASAFERAGRTRMARNAIIVLANTGDKAFAPQCGLGAADVDPIVRATAAHGLVRLGDRKAAAQLLADPDETVRREAAAALTRSLGDDAGKGTQAVELAVRWLQSEKPVTSRLRVHIPETKGAHVR